MHVVDGGLIVESVVNTVNNLKSTLSHVRVPVNFWMVFPLVL